MAKPITVIDRVGTLRTIGWQFVSHVVTVILSSRGFLERLAPEDGADTVSRTAGNILPCNAPGHARRAKTVTAPCREMELIC
jgi:hypothetical protein